VNLPAGTSAEDVAFFVGRVPKGLNEIPSITARATLRTVVKVVVIIAGLHLPAVATRGVQSAAQHVGHAATTDTEALRSDLSEAGVHLSREEAVQMIEELVADDNTRQHLQEVENTLQHGMPLLEQLYSAWQGEN
jgi:hypothetical protein